MLFTMTVSVKDCIRQRNTAKWQFHGAREAPNPGIYPAALLCSKVQELTKVVNLPTSIRLLYIP